MKIVTFASGSKGNCTLVSSDRGHLLIDAGISMRRMIKNIRESGLEAGDISGILLTHEHSDHVAGLGMLEKHYNIPVFAPVTVAQAVCSAGVPAERIKIFESGERFAVGNYEVLSFATPHDTRQSVGYRITGDGIFAIATDMGHVTDTVLGGLMGAEAVVLESNHDEQMLKNGSYPYHLKRRILSPTGHLSNDCCARLAGTLSENGTKYIVLGHLSQENNSPDLAYETVKRAISGTGAELFVAPAAERLSIQL